MQDPDTAGHAAFCIRNEFRVGTLREGAGIFRIEDLVRRHAHPHVAFHHLIAEQDFVDAKLLEAPRDQRRCAHLEPAALGILMEVVTLLDKLRRDRLRRPDNCLKSFFSCHM